MMDVSIWSALLTVAMAVISLMAKWKMDHIDDRFTEMDRISQLLNKTREEIARDHVTRAEMTSLMDRIGERFDRSFERLETKIDEMRKG